jgi:hypothetical protein
VQSMHVNEWFVHEPESSEVNMGVSLCLI